MGVPLLLTWLRKHFSDCFVQPSAMGVIDNLYVDLNSLLYPAVNLAAERLLKAASAARISSVGSSASNSAEGNDIGSSWAVSLKEAEDAILLALIGLLEQVCSMANPLSLLYIAADGVSPIGKMSQQRARRQNSTAKNSAKRLCDASGFDITSLTCGTSFMERVTHAAHFFSVSYTDRTNAQRYQQYLGALQRGGAPDASEAGLPPPTLLTAVVNDATTPGEGEHKLFEAIRAFRTSAAYRHDVRHCVCSSDTDVIVSSLTLHEPYTYALRYDPSGPHEPMSFSITRFREALYSRLGSPRPCDVFERGLHDFVFLLLLFGNDFLPRISATADIAEGTLDLLIRFLADNFVCRGKRLVDEVTGEIHVEAAVYFFDYLSEISGKGGGAATVGLRSGGGLQVHGDVDWGFAEAPSATGEQLPAKARDNIVEKRCHAYWTMLQWAMQYTSGGVPSWNSAYPYTTVPTLEELRCHCHVSWDSVVVHGVPNKPLDVTTQLLLLTPGRSVPHVVPASLLRDYEATIAPVLQGPFENICIASVVAWSAARREWLTAAERKRLNSYDMGGVGLLVHWDASTVGAELAAARKVVSESHRRAPPDSGSVAAPKLKTIFSSATTGNKLGGLGGAGALKMALFGAPKPPAVPAQQEPSTPNGESTPVFESNEQSSTTDDRSLSEGCLKRDTLLIGYSPLPSSDAVAVSTIHGGAFRCAIPFHSDSSHLPLKRGIYEKLVFLRICRAALNPHILLAPSDPSASNAPQWLPLPLCADADISAVVAQRHVQQQQQSRKREREDADEEDAKMLQEQIRLAISSK